MMRLGQRTFLLLALGAFAIVWTFLMGIGVRPAASATGTGPGFSAGNTNVAGTGATVKYVDESHFPAVTVYLAANDQGGQPVLGLQKDNFTLTEDGQPVAITNFAAAGSQAATVLLVIDSSGSMADENKMAGAQQAAISFIQHLQPGQDRAGLLVFSSQINVNEPLNTVSPASRQTLIDQIQAITPNGDTEFYLAVQTAIEQLKPEAGRKVVLALTDGLDRNRQDRLADTITLAQQANVPVYAIGLGNDVDADGMQQLAQQSGGTYNFSPSADQLEKLYLDIASTLRNEYALTYQSATPNQDGTRRNLNVAFTTASGQTIEGKANYGVGGVLASSRSLALFLPLFGVLLIGLFVLYQWPGRRRSSSPPQDKIEPTPIASVTPVTLQARAIQPASMNQPQAAVMATGPAAAVATLSPPIAQFTAPEPASPIARSGTAALVWQVPLPAAENILGSGPGCQVTLAYPSIMAQHARIAQVDDRYIVDDLSNGKTQVSFGGDPTQLRMIQRNALRDGALLQIGEERLVFRQAIGQLPALERRYPLTSAGLTLGSDAACDIVIAGSAPHQARVVQDGPRWIVEDLAGGAFVSFSGNPAQERPLAGRNALKAGSTVRMATATLRLEI